MYSYWVARTFRLKMRSVGGSDPHVRIIVQYQFHNWHDHRVVQFSTPVVNFLRKLRNASSEQATGVDGSDRSTPSLPYKSSLTLVHCSAGIGRTGTLIASDIIIKKAEMLLKRKSPHDVEVDVRNTVSNLREQRHKMVQNLEQYMFVYETVYEALSCTSVTPSVLDARICDAQPPNDERLQREFDTLERNKPIIPRQEFDVAMDIKNAGKNRVQKILPPGFCRVAMLTPSDDRQDYFAGIWLDGVQRPRDIIAAQSPMPHTISDFWSVIWDWNVSVVVSLDTLPCFDPSYSSVGPESESEIVQHGPFRIKSLRKTASSCGRESSEDARPYVVDVLGVLHCGKRALPGFEVRHFTYCGNWQDNVRAVPNSVDQFAEFITAIDEARKVAENRPILIHCLDGCSRTGIAVASVLMKEQFNIDDEIDAFQQVKMLRNSRPEFVSNIVSHLILIPYLKL